MAAAAGPEAGDPDPVPPPTPASSRPTITPSTRSNAAMTTAATSSQAVVWAAAASSTGVTTGATGGSGSSCGSAGRGMPSAWRVPQVGPELASTAIMSPHAGQRRSVVSEPVRATSQACPLGHSPRPAVAAALLTDVDGVERPGDVLGLGGRRRDHVDRAVAVVGEREHALDLELVGHVLLPHHLGDVLEGRAGVDDEPADVPVAVDPQLGLELGVVDHVGQAWRRRRAGQ